jgi:hypothetical protein
MDNSRRYAELLTQVLRQVANRQANLRGLKVQSVCDVEAGQFLIIATGWEGETWRNLMLFHARLQDGKIIVEDNNFEKMLEDLVEAGIPEVDIVSIEDLEEMTQSVA